MKIKSIGDMEKLVRELAGAAMLMLTVERRSREEGIDTLALDNGAVVIEHDALLRWAAYQPYCDPFTEQNVKVELWLISRDPDPVKVVQAALAHIVFTRCNDFLDLAAEEEAMRAQDRQSSAHEEQEY
jgi:hypothetical protein